MLKKGIILMLIMVLAVKGGSSSTSTSTSTGTAWGGNTGKWDLLLNNSGVVAMHMALTHLDTVVIYDQTQAGRSGYRLRPSCAAHSNDSSSSSCWAHSVEYDIASNTLRPLTLKTDTWCSSGAFLSHGTLLQTGGNLDGVRKIRHFRPCSDKRCDWVEWEKTRLSEKRWYATTLILPEEEDRVVVVGGRDSFTYEFLPKFRPNEGAFYLPFLRRTRLHQGEENNLYPFVHVSSDGNLFIFANRDSILFDYKRRGKVVRRFPRMPGGGSRNYPSTGSSVMLPLDYADEYKKVEIMVCGGAAQGAYRAAQGAGVFLTGLTSCGRMVITDREPEWEMEEMPAPRLMNDMLLLPTGNVLLVNGATRGAAGWELARNASLHPFLYKPDGAKGERFRVLRSTEVKRVYHSSAILLPDGRILVAGSNPHRNYVFDGGDRRVKEFFPTELRLETFTPHYMLPFFDAKRPANLTVLGSAAVRHGEEFRVRFGLARRPAKVVEVYLYAPPFVTHSFSMNQRMVKLKWRGMVREGSDGEEEGGGVGVVVVVSVTAPPSPSVAPAGYYLLFLVNGGIPSKGFWVRLIRN
ncbi:hypothetical protein H6P81_012493 [Aristolochia fimbriata]|uniref:Uncharacterized protein n=1 Tax=Aristolochia fimbriata TaxID=158543 RepID=A0AAV7EE32_ARIFI|nr:hypothetical protein H6P81_012493 [Aristolochia fimbriata]